ncbi:MAG: hypothetical protein C0475_07600 [Planctomyces sp.]|nr:hypothetical protein [Planctomyces sp.]
MMVGGTQPSQAARMLLTKTPLSRQLLSVCALGGASMRNAWNDGSWKGVRMTQDASKRRLGRGLSSLMGVAVPIEPPSTSDASPSQGASRAQTPAAAGQRPAEANAHTYVSPIRVDEPAQAPPRAAEHHAAVLMIELGAISPGRFQPRRAFDESGLAALAASIRTAGVMQPVLVRPASVIGRGAGLGDGGGGGAAYELIAGERRWRAAALAGLTRIPAVVTQLDDRQAAEWGLIENVQREDLGVLDRALGYQQLAQRFAMTYEQVAQRVGIAASSVSNHVRLLELEPALLDMLGSGALSMGHGKALLSAPSGEDRLVLGRRAAAERWSVRRTELEANRLRRAAGQRAVGGSGQDQNEESLLRARRLALQLDRLERAITARLGTKVSLRATGPAGHRGRIVIEYYSFEQFDGLMRTIGVETGDA